MPASQARRRGSQTQLRAANAEAVVAALQQGPATQADIARTTDLSGATVSTIVRELLAEGTVTVAPGGGRGQLLRLSPLSGLTAGISIGRTRTLVALGDLTSDVLGVQEMPVPPGTAVEASVEEALRALDDLLADAGVDRAALLTVGVALPVEVPTSGPGGVGDAARAVLATLDVPVLVDNDANLGARAEVRWGLLADAAVGAWVKASTGVGVGLVTDGRVVRGAKGTAGELGHVSVAAEGPVCACGNRGCLELYAGGPALTAEYAASTGRGISIADLVTRALDDDPVARRLIEDAGTRIGTALAGLVTLLDPAVVVLGGDLADAGDLLLEPLAAALRRRGKPSVVEGVTIAVSPLGDRAVVLGALALALDSARPRRSPTRAAGRLADLPGASGSAAPAGPTRR